MSLKQISPFVQGNCGARRGCAVLRSRRCSFTKGPQEGRIGVQVPCPTNSLLGTPHVTISPTALLPKGTSDGTQLFLTPTAQLLSGADTGPEANIQHTRGTIRNRCIVQNKLTPSLVAADIFTVCRSHTTNKYLDSH